MLKDIMYSTLWNKCPKCHNKKVFKAPFYDLKNFHQMNASCECCGEVYEKEPGGFYGAMYVSYALMAGWFIVTYSVDSFFVHAEIWQYLVFVVSTMVIFMPLTFRISRLLWLNFFIRYQKNTCRQNPEKSNLA